MPSVELQFMIVKKMSELSSYARYSYCLGIIVLILFLRFLLCRWEWESNNRRAAGKAEGREESIGGWLWGQKGKVQRVVSSKGRYTIDYVCIATILDTPYFFLLQGNTLFIRPLLYVLGSASSVAETFWMCYKTEIAHLGMLISSTLTDRSHDHRNMIWNNC